MVELAVDMCVSQARAERKFIFEHPAWASSWDLPCLERLRDLPGVESVVFHMCRFGMVMEDKVGSGLVYKPTRVVTNSEAIARHLDRQCPRDHRHVQLEGDRTGRAAEYPEQLCDAFLDGLTVERCVTMTMLAAAADDGLEFTRAQDSF